MENYILLNEDGSIILENNIMVEGKISQAGSKMLEDYKAPYSSTLVNRLDENGVEIHGLAKTSEFDLGEEKTIFECMKKEDIDLGLGTDTLGNFLKGALEEEVPAFVPSYGALSKYGVITGVSSIVSPGLAGDFDKIEEAYNFLAGFDENDPTSIKDLPGIKLVDTRLDSISLALFGEIDDRVKEKLANKEEISLDHADLIEVLGDVILSVEAASGTAKFDGIRYGYRTEDYDDLDDLFSKTRSEGFSKETIELIVKGMYYSGHYYDREIYEKAIRLRRLLLDEVDRQFEKTDFILGSRESGLAELSSLIGYPSLAVKGLVLLGPAFRDSEVLSLAKKLEEVL